MISTSLKMLIALILLVSISIVPASAQKQSSNSDADSAAIKQTIAEWSGAFSSHDAQACAMRFHEDGDFVSVSGLTFHGRKAIEEHYATVFSGTLKSARRVDTVKSIRFLSPTIASVDVTWEMTGSRTADGSERPLRKGLLEPVLTKENGQWVITVFHETEFAVAPAK